MDLTKTPDLVFDWTFFPKANFEQMKEQLAKGMKDCFADYKGFGFVCIGNVCYDFVIGPDYDDNYYALHSNAYFKHPENSPREPYDDNLKGFSYDDDFYLDFPDPAAYLCLDDVFYEDFKREFEESVRNFFPFLENPAWTKEKRFDHRAFLEAMQTRGKFFQYRHLLNHMILKWNGTLDWSFFSAEAYEALKNDIQKGTMADKLATVYGKVIICYVTAVRITLGGSTPEHPDDLRAQLTLVKVPGQPYPDITKGLQGKIKAGMQYDEFKKAVEQNVSQYIADITMQSLWLSLAKK